jgi:hypothetical protein
MFKYGLYRSRCVNRWGWWAIEAGDRCRAGSTVFSRNLNQQTVSPSHLFRIVTIDRIAFPGNLLPRSGWPDFATQARNLPGYNYQPARLFMYFQKE